MKIGKTVKWMFLFTICNLSAQNNYSVDFGINTQPTEKIKMNEVSFGLDFSKTIHSKFRIVNEVSFNSKTLHYFDFESSNSFTKYNHVSDKFTFSYLKRKKMIYNIEIEPFVASENNFKWNDIDLLGGINLDFNWSPNNKIKLGISRNTIFGKPMILPVFAYDYQYSNDLNFSIGFPETNIKYSNNPRNTFYIKNVFNGSVYNLDDSSKISSKASFSQQTTSLEYERNMDANWFVNFKMGYDFNRKYLLQDSNYNTTFDFGINDGCNFGVTIKYKH